MEQAVVSPEKFIGTLNVWFGDRGYGFIRLRDGEGQIVKLYFHVSKLLPNQQLKPAVGAQVRFDVKPELEGAYPTAINVEVVGVPEVDPRPAIIRTKFTLGEVVGEKIGGVK